MRQKLFSSERPDVVYAVGDVHGCLDLLHALQSKIEADAEQESGSKCLIMLGDYVDRGPRSALVLEELIQPMRGNLQRYCLAGNHEETMLDFIRNPSHDHLWLEFGGGETLRSYGMREIPSDGRHLRALIQQHIPQRHIDFIASLPSLISIPGFCFVHAGVVNGVPLEQQLDKHLLWIRPNEQAAPTVANPFLTVHGHTPIRQVALVNNRLNVDTGAFMTGRLSAVKIKGDAAITVFHSD
ncbi:serine/threonine protein phosphatase [Agrobacterium larrymoorei]|uniref:metallophosphoesterase family protein n=1 Tax=Agrobacterium larrymoorei TaxID=160699 RepID=UPI0015721F4F|nr:metallophosphoesterase family protein [Agrobacterium larrymoorei]NTJ41841.1 serine/threonine protein phosphatase [Agrobacterium larrymoorei]